MSDANTPDTPETDQSNNPFTPAAPNASAPSTPPAAAMPTAPAAPAAPQYAPPVLPAASSQGPPYPAPPSGPAYAAPHYAPPQPGYGASPAPMQAQPGYTPYGARPNYAMALPAPGPGEPFDGALHADELGRPLYGATMGQAIARFFKNYANFTGRASRSEYWWLSLAYALAGLVFMLLVALLAGVASAASPYAYGMSEAVSALIGLLTIAAVLGLIVPSLALTWRRLHDANLAGPLYFLALVPYVGGLVVLVFMILPPRPEGRRFDRFTR